MGIGRVRTFGLPALTLDRIEAAKAKNPKVRTRRTSVEAYVEAEGQIRTYQPVKPIERPLLAFSVACLPVPQPRQRHRVVRSGPKAYATNYTPAKHPVNAFKAAIMFEARKFCDRPLPLGPIEVRLRFRFTLPASAKVELRRRLDLGQVLPHFTRPDADNLEKGVWDALTGLLWGDDRQIARHTTEKVYAREAGVDVWVAVWE